MEESRRAVTQVSFFGTWFYTTFTASRLYNVVYTQSIRSHLEAWIFCNPTSLPTVREMSSMAFNDPRCAIDFERLSVVLVHFRSYPY